MRKAIKAGRLDRDQLGEAIAQAANEAQARISNIGGAAIDSISGGVDIVTTTIGDHDDGDDWTTDGAVMPDPFPMPDTVKF